MMIRYSSPTDIEAVVDVDHVPTDSKSSQLAGNCEVRSNSLEIDDGTHIKSPNNDETDAPNNNIGTEKVPLPKKIKALFFLSYSGFLILFLVFFLVIAYTYPLKPELFIQQFYLPVFDKTISSNITDEMKDLVFFQLRFNNRNELISVSYDDFLNITIYYLPNTTTSIYFANTTIPGFYQHRVKPMIRVVQTPAPGLSGLLRLQEEFITMVFQVDLEFKMTFHCRELGKHKHRFVMTAEFEVPLATGSSFEDTIQMYESSS